MAAEAESTTVVEVWEYQQYDRNKGWITDESLPWATKSFEPSDSIYEITTPGPEWHWTTNWRIDIKANLTDSSGWEYASSLSRFHVSNRPPKTEKKWNDKSRRRLLTRSMQREMVSYDFAQVIPQIQQGLNSILQARLEVEKILSENPEAAQTEQMKHLLSGVKKNIANYYNVLEQAEKHQQSQTEAINGASNGNTPSVGRFGYSASTQPQAATIKKLRNDLNKQEVALERLIRPSGKNTSVKSIPPSPMMRRSTTGNIRDSQSQPIGISQANGTINAPKTTQADSVSSNHSLNSSSAQNTQSFAASLNTGSVNTGSLNRTVTGGRNAGTFRIESRNIGADDTDDHSSRAWEEEDGVFMDRTMEELRIEQKLKPVDQAAVLQDIIDERNAEITKIHKGIIEVNEMFVDLARHVKEQEGFIDNIYQHVEESHSKTKQAIDDIRNASQLQKETNCIIS